MAAQPCPQLVSYEEFVRLAETSPVKVELHFGQVIEMARPTPRHIEIQYRLQDLLRAVFGSAWAARIEMPYRAFPQFEARSADVGVASNERWQAALKTDSLFGSPEIVIEIFSPKSNAAAEMAEKATLCLGTGALQFWVVDDRYSIVTVTTPDGRSVYGAGGTIPLGIAGATIAVSDFFA
jgi:Uma2 family endonuclease